MTLAAQEHALLRPLLLYAALWMSFAIGHSVLASRPTRRLVIALVGASERLMFNTVAIVHLTIVLAAGHALFANAPGFDLPPFVRVDLAGLQVCGAIGLVVVLRSYDLGRFGGLTQWRTRAPDSLVAPDGALVTAGLHAYVRHPLYTASIVLLLGGATSPFGLATAAFGTAYLVVGLRFEERKLLAVYGAPYQRYRERVPALLPIRLL